MKETTKKLVDDITSTMKSMFGKWEITTSTSHYCDGDENKREYNTVTAVIKKLARRQVIYQSVVIYEDDDVRTEKVDGDLFSTDILGIDENNNCVELMTVCETEDVECYTVDYSDNAITVFNGNHEIPAPCVLKIKKLA